MKLSKNGFNLGEMLICIGLISVVVAMMIPAVMSKKPGKNKALFRKAYYNTEKVIYELANDEDSKLGFPGTKITQFKEGQDQSTGFGYFKNDQNVKIPTGGAFTTVARTKANNGKYLCSKIAERMNTVGFVDCNTIHTMPIDGTKIPNGAMTSAGPNNTPNFVTTDGVAWYISIGQICVNDRAGCASDTWVEINVDVNGVSQPDKKTGTDPDRFTFSFDPLGKMRVDSEKGKRYLRTNAIYKD